MIIKQATTSRDKQDAIHVRSDVFIKEQHVPESIELDALDNEAIHFVGYEDAQPIAASRLRLVDHYGKLERVCVLRSYRNKSYGKQLIAHMEADIRQRGFKQSVLNAQTQAIRFYEQLGYTTCSDEFMDAGIPHVTMKKTLI